MSSAPRGSKKRSTGKRAMEKIGRIYLPLTVGIAFVVVLVFMILHNSASSQQATENLSILGGILLAVAIVVYLSPGTQEKLRQRSRARQDEIERQFWAKRDENDLRQAEAQARLEAERRRRREEREQKKKEQGH